MRTITCFIYIFSDNLEPEVPLYMWKVACFLYMRKMPTICRIKLVTINHNGDISRSCGGWGNDIILCDGMIGDGGCVGYGSD